MTEVVTRAAGSGHQEARLTLFFVLTFALAVPFWALGYATEFELLPGLPVAALSFVCPGLAAVIVARREGGSAGVNALLKRAFDYKRIEGKGWYAPVLLLNPAIFLVSYMVQEIAGMPVPAPQVSLLSVLLLSATFFAAGLGEELGWSGFAIDPLQNRCGALRASVLLGAVWAIFHFVALEQAHRSLEWISWWSLWTISARVIMVCIYNSTGKSVFGMALYHASSNVSWQLFPIHGSFFDPRVTGIITTFVAILAAAFWDPRRAHAPES
jgi:membrane protease YdiL (CAAX protease family)